MAHTYPAESLGFQDFYSNGHNAFGCATTALTALFNAADQCLIDFDCTGKRFASRIHHGNPKTL